MNTPSAPVPDEDAEGPDPVVLGLAAAFVISERTPEAETIQSRRCMELECSCMNDAAGGSPRFARKRGSPDRPACRNPRTDAEIACGRLEPLQPEKILCHLCSLLFRGKMDMNGNGFRGKNQPGGLKICRVQPIMIPWEF